MLVMQNAIFYERIDELSSPQVPAGFMEAYTFWPEKHGWNFVLSFKTLPII